jgi:plastocyanin
LKIVRHLPYVATLSIVALVVTVPVAGAQQQEDQGAGTPAPNVWSVSIGDYFFDPADAAVEPGDSIVFVNEGAEAHTVTADDGQFDSGPLNPGESFEVSFEGSGTVTYHCQIHPEMVGSVAVGEASEPTQPAGETIYVPGGTLTHYESVG